MIRITALDDHPFILEGYQAILHGNEKMVWCGGFTSGEDLLDHLKEESCDVILMDIHLGGEKDGVYWCKNLSRSFPEMGILGISTFDEFGIVKTFLAAGGNGFILKSAGKKVFEEAILSVYQGKEYIQEKLKESLLAQSLKNKPSNEYKPRLSRRETEILKLIVAEMTTQEIATELNLSTHTVESHRGNLIAKLGVKNVAGLVREAYRKDLL